MSTMVTLSLDEVMDLINAAQVALPYLADQDPMGEEGEEQVFDRLLDAIGTLTTSLFAEHLDSEDWVPGPPPPFTAGKNMPEMEHRIEIVDGEEIIRWHTISMKSRPMFCLSQEGE